MVVSFGVGCHRKKSERADLSALRLLAPTSNLVTSKGHVGVSAHLQARPEARQVVVVEGVPRGLGEVQPHCKDVAVRHGGG